MQAAVPSAFIPTPAAAPPTAASTSTMVAMASPRDQDPPPFTYAPASPSASTWRTKPGTGFAAPDPLGRSVPNIGPRSPRTGRLKVLCGKSYGNVFYIRAKLNGSGTFKRTSRADEAVQVLWDPENEPHKLKLLVNAVSLHQNRYVAESRVECPRLQGPLSWM